jgi:hypothetical protein
MLSRALTPFEKWFFSTNEVVQFGVQLATSRYADQFIDFLDNSVPCCHLRSDGLTLTQEPAPLPISKLPPALRTARDAAIWAGDSFLPTYSQRLASIAARDNLVVLAVNHAFADGVSLLNLADAFSRGVPRVVETGSQGLPVPLEVHLKDELAAPLDVSSHLSDVARHSCLPWSDSVPALPEDVRCAYQCAELPPTAFQCFDSKRNRLVGFSDAAWRSAILACAALNPSQTGFGTSTCLNMRPFLKENVQVGNIFVPVWVVADGISNETRIEELDRRLRRDFAAKMQQKKYINSFKACLNGIEAPPHRASYVDVSNVGVFELRHPVLDVWAQQTVKSRAGEGIISALTYGVSSREFYKIIVRMQTSPTVVNERDASRWFAALLHGLQHIRPSGTVGDAVRELRDVVHA